MIRILLLVFFCGALTSSVFAGERILTESFDRTKPSYIKVDGRGNIWTAYYDLKGNIHVRNASGDRDLIVNEGRERAASGLVLDAQGDNIYVAWREKIGGKKLWFRASHDGGKTLSEPILLDKESGALTRIKMGSDSRGNVFVVWYGENVSKTVYNLDCTASNDFGKTFSEVKNLTPEYEHSVYPTLLVDEGGAYVFSDSMKKKWKTLHYLQEDCRRGQDME